MTLHKRLKRNWTISTPQHNESPAENGHVRDQSARDVTLKNLFVFNSSLSRRDHVLRVSADIVNEVVKESATQIIQSVVDEMVKDHMTIIKTDDWLEDFMLEAIGPMPPRVVGTSFLCSIT